MPVHAKLVAYLFLILCLIFQALYADDLKSPQENTEPADVIKFLEPTRTEIPNYNVPEIQRSATKIVALLAKAQHYAEAAEELKMFSNFENIMSKVVRETYAGQQSNLKNCLKLLLHLNCDAIASGVRVLFDEMRGHNHLSQPEVLLFVEYIRLYGCNWKPEVVGIEAKLKPYVTSILSKLGSDIRKGNFQALNQTFDWQKDYSYMYSLESQMPKIVRLALDGNETNFLSTFRFIMGLPNFGEFVGPGVGPGIYTLVQELVKLEKTFSSEMMLLAKYMRSTGFLKWINYTNSKLTHESVTYAWELIPSQFRGVLKENYICDISPNALNKYSLAVDKNGTQISDFIPYFVGRWKFKSYTSSKYKIFFTIKHLRRYWLTRYLCADDDAGFACLVGSGDEAVWEIKPVPKEKAFLLFNKSTKEYLSLALTENSLNGLKLKSSKTADSGSYWSILCSWDLLAN